MAPSLGPAVVESPNRIESLLDEGPFLGRLARALVRDEDLADDLIQETWLAALRKPPEGDVRSWFTAVARNFVRRSSRAASDREQRERSVARHELGPSPEEIQRRESVRGLVVEKVLGLPEPYRTVVLLRFFESWKPRRIAREMGCPVETVKTRLKRALERLRDELDRESGGQRGAWALGLSQAGRLKAASAPLAQGVLLLSTKTKIAVATILLATLVATTSFLLLAGDRSKAIRATSSRSALEGPGSLPQSTDEGIARPRIDDQRVPAAQPGSDASPRTGPTTSPRIADGTVVDLLAAAVPDVSVVFLPRDAAEPSKGHGATSDASGGFRLEIPDQAGSLTTGPGSWVGVFEPRIEETVPASRHLLVVAPVSRLSGRVVDDQGAPISGAQVTLELPASLQFKVHGGMLIGPDNEIRATFPLNLDRCATAKWTTSSDPQGEFSIANAPRLPRAHVVTSHSGYATDHRGLPVEGSNVTIVLHLSAESVNHLRGLVVDANGVPVSGAALFLGSIRAGTEDDGRFDLSLGGHPSGDHLIAVKEGWLPVSQSCRAPSPADPGAWPDPLVLVLKEESLVIRGHVIDSQGRPLPRCRVRTADPSTLEEVLAWAGIQPPSADGVKGIGFGGRDASTDDGGSFVLRSLAPRSYHLRALDLDSLALSASIAVKAGSVDVLIRVDTDASYPCVAGEVVDSAGHPVADMRVVAVRGTPDGEERSAEIKTDSEGRFRMQRLSREADTISVWPERIVPRRFRIGEQPDLCSLRLVVPRPGDLKIELASAGLTADAFAVLGKDGTRLQVEKHWGGGSQGPYDTVPIVDGSSDWTIVPDDAGTVILYKDGNEVLRRSLQLKPGELNLLKL